MNSKKLANVLIKILGLSLCAHGAENFISGVIFMATTGGGVARGFWMILVSSLVPAAIGVGLILQSRLITDKLIKSEDE